MIYILFKFCFFKKDNSNRLVYVFKNIDFFINSQGFFLFIVLVNKTLFNVTHKRCFELGLSEFEVFKYLNSLKFVFKVTNSVFSCLNRFLNFI